MSSNLEQGSAQPATTGSGSTNINSAAIVATTTSSEIPNSNESGSGDLNTSIGSQRSLNSRIFPTSFRISRDIILNNVSHVQCQINYLAFQCHKNFYYRFFKKFGR